jgi:D-alanyl-D-alanine dipeptidase
MILAILLMALATAPPTGAWPEPLVDAAQVVPGLSLDLRYGTPRNMLKRPLYPAGARCLMRPKVAERLKQAQELLAKKGLGLKVFDCYRPLSVQQLLWDKLPIRGLVAPPSIGGSNHNRGAAVDASLVGPDGRELEMPTDFDDFTKKARTASPLPSPEARRNRDLLQAVMRKAGFNAIPMEWWHFDAPDALEYQALDLPVAPSDPDQGLAAPPDSAPKPRLHH